MAARTRGTTGSSEFNLGSWLISFAGKLLFLVVMIVVILTLSQCTIKKPEAPEWTTQMVVPIVNRTYHMDEIIRRADQNGLTLVNDTVRFSKSYDLDTLALDGDNLSTGNMALAFSDQVGEISIARPDVPPASITLTSIPGLAGFVGGTVPETDFQTTQALPVISTFSSATISSGHLYVVIQNDLGIPISNVGVQLRDQTYAYMVDQRFIAGPIASGSADSVMMLLNGKTISNSLRIDVSAHTTGGPLPLATGKELATGVNFSPTVTVINAVAQVPAFTISSSDHVALSESDPITSATLKTGILSVAVSNNTELDANLTIEVPELQQSGSHFTVNQFVAANSTANVASPLEGYELLPSGSSAPQLVAVEVHANIVGSGSNLRNVNQLDAIAINAQLTNLTFSQVSGVFSATGATITPFVEDIDVPTGFESFQLKKAILTIEVENNVGLAGDLDLVVTGSNGKIMHIMGPVEAAGLSTAATTVLVDTTAADFLFPFPDQITVTGSALFGNGVTTGTLKDGDYVFARVTIDAPFEVIVTGAPIETDIQSESIDQEDIDAITDHVVEARFVYNVINHLPLGAQLELYLSADSATLYTNPELVIDGISVGAAPTLSGVAIDTASTGYQTVTLSNADIQVLKHDTLFIGQVLSFEDSNGQSVLLTGNDSLRIVGRFEVDYQFDGEF